MYLLISFRKPPTKSSTYCFLLQIKMLSWRFCGGVDFLKLINKYIVSDNFGVSGQGFSITTCFPLNSFAIRCTEKREVTRYLHSVAVLQIDTSPPSAHRNSARVWLGRLIHRNVQRFRGGLVFKAHRLLHHSTLGLRVIKKRMMDLVGEPSDRARTQPQRVLVLGVRRAQRHPQVDFLGEGLGFRV